AARGGGGGGGGAARREGQPVRGGRGEQRRARRGRAPGTARTAQSAGHRPLRRPQVVSMTEASVSDGSVTRVVNDGPANDGAVNDGAVNDGAVNDGAVNAAFTFHSRPRRADRLPIDEDRHVPC